MPEERGVRLNDKGFLVQDIMPDAQTSISGEMLWDLAMRRRACAMDISGLSRMESWNLWHNVLRMAMFGATAAWLRGHSLAAGEECRPRSVQADCREVHGRGQGKVG